MSPAYSIVAASQAAGPVTVVVATPHFPHAFAALLWEYDAQQQLVGGARDVSTAHPTVMIGAPDAIDRHYFYVEGRVFHSNDDPPTPYVVTVGQRQGAMVIHDEVPADGGSGSIGTADRSFTLTFQIAKVLP